MAQWLDLETFNDPSLIGLAQVVGRWAANVKRHSVPHWLTLLGKSGTGKTHCARKLWKWLCDFHNADSIVSKGGLLLYQPRFIHWPSFVMDLRSGKEYERIADMRQWPFLILDEVGAERDSTGFASEHLATLLGCRVRKWTVITSNLSVEGFAALDTRIASRMHRDNGIVFEVDSLDYAFRMQRQ